MLFVSNCRVSVTSYLRDKNTGGSGAVDNIFGQIGGIMPSFFVGKESKSIH